MNNSTMEALGEYDKMSKEEIKDALRTRFNQDELGGLFMSLSLLKDAIKEGHERDKWIKTNP